MYLWTLLKLRKNLAIWATRVQHKVVVPTSAVEHDLGVKLVLVVLGMVNNEHGQPPGLMSDEGVHAGCLLVLSLLPGLCPLELDSFNNEELLVLDGLKVDIDSLASQ